jgi:hypothetical protein
MNIFDFIIGFNSTTYPGDRIIPDKKFISYFPLKNAKNTPKSINKRLNILSPNSTILDSSKDTFPFNIPFHPGEGPEIIYPDGPVEPEDPEEDPGDEPDDY